MEKFWDSTSIKSCLPSLLCLSLMTKSSWKHSHISLKYALNSHSPYVLSIKFVQWSNVSMQAIWDTECHCFPKVASCWKHPGSFKNPHARPQYQRFRVSLVHQGFSGHECIKSTLGGSAMQSLWSFIYF
jgi:hypothetical protein